MENQRITFSGLLSAVAGDTHPYQKRLRFVFTDFQPNSNKQGVPRSEASNLIKSAINMPIKTMFKYNKIYEHPGSFPIGNITSMEEVDDKLIGEAVIWPEEFPEFIEYFDSKPNEDINFSWELKYRNSQIDENGTSWLQDCNVLSAVIVATPAYAGRTPLIARASDEEQTRSEEMSAEAETTDTEVKPEGTTPVVSERPNLDTPLSNGERPSMEVPATVVEDPVLAELEQLREYKRQIEEDKIQKDLEETRKTQFDEARELFSEDLFQTQSNFIYGLSNDQFSQFLSILKLVKPPVTQKSEASSKNNGSTGVFPDPVSQPSNSEVDIKSLARQLKKYGSGKTSA